MSDSSDEEDSISKIDFSVISMAIEAGHKMVQQILNCVHYGTPEVRNLMYNECDFIVECRVCHNLFRSIPNFVAHKRIYCTAEFEQSEIPSSSQEESVVVVQPMDTSSGQTSGSVSPVTKTSTSSSITKPSTAKSTPTGSVNHAKSVLSSVFSSSHLSQSRITSESTSGVNVSGSEVAGRSTREQCRHRGQGNRGQGQENQVQGQDGKKDDEDSSDGDTSTLKQLLTGKFKGKSSEYNFYSKTAEKMERERRAKEVSHVVMTPIPTNKNAAYLTVTQGGTASDVQNAIVSSQIDRERAVGLQNSSESLSESVINQNRENTGDKNNDTQQKGSVRSSKRKNPDAPKIVNEGPISKSPENTLLSKQKQMEQKNKKFVQLRPVKSQLGSHQYSELSELGLLGHCDLAMCRCLLCSISYSSRKGLLQHMHSIHSGRKILFPCSMCDKRFSYFWGLTRHLQNNHNLSKEKIDKIRDKLKSMAYDIADLEESGHKEQVDPRVSPGTSSEGLKQGKASIKHTPDIVQTGFVPRTVGSSETSGLKLNKCDGCKRAFWKKSNYDEHISQCKWLITSTVDKPSTNSRSTGRSRLELSRDVPALRGAESVQNRPSTRSKVMEKDIDFVSSNVMDNLESIERRARLRTRSKVNLDEQTKQCVPLTETSATDGRIGEKQTTADDHHTTENDHDSSRDGSEFSRSSRHKEKYQDEKSPVSSPSKRSDSSSPNASPKQQIVTRHSAKSLEKETLYMRTRFFDKRRESQIRPDRSPQSKSGSEANSPTLQKKDSVKTALEFDGVQDGKMNKPRDRSGSGSRGSGKTTPSTSPGKERQVSPSVAHGNDPGQKRSVLKGKTDISDSSTDDTWTKNGECSMERADGKSVEGGRERRQSGGDGLMETGRSRPSTRSIQRTGESVQDKTQTTSSRRQKSPTDSRDSSTESHSLSRVSTRSSSSSSSQAPPDRSRSRDIGESNPAGKDRQNSPVRKDGQIVRDSSKENIRSSSRTRNRNASNDDASGDNSKDRISTRELSKDRISTRELSKDRTSTRELSKDRTSTRELSKELISTPEPSKERISTRELSKDRISTRELSKDRISTRELSKDRISTRELSKELISTPEPSKERISSRISTRNISAPMSDETETDHNTSATEPEKVPSENLAKDSGGMKSEQHHQGEVNHPSVRKSSRASARMTTDQDREAIGSEPLKPVSKDTTDTIEKANAGDSCQKYSGNKPGIRHRKTSGSEDRKSSGKHDQKTVGSEDGNVPRVTTRRSDKLDCKNDNSIEKHDLPNHPTASKVTTEQSSVSQSSVTRRSLSNTSGEKDISAGSSTRSSGIKGTNNVSLKETRSSLTKKTEPNKLGGKTQEGDRTKGDNSDLDKNEGSEFQIRSARIRDKITTGKEDESRNSSPKKVDEVDGESSFRSTRLSNASRMKAQKMKDDGTRNKEEVSQRTEIQVGNMIISSVPPENQSFLGLRVSPHTRRNTTRASTQFTPRIPKGIVSMSDRQPSNTAETISDSQPEESTGLGKSFISDRDEKDSESDRSSVSSTDETNSDFISASPEPEVKLVEEIWVQKEPGLPSEEVRSNAYAMMTYKSNSTQSSSKGPSASTSGHATRASERMRTSRTQMYVTDPKNVGTSQESVQTRCLDLSRIAYLSDEKEMKCLQCGLGFSGLSNLRRHVVRHLGWRRYKCKLCKFSSYNKSECNTHLIRSHGTKARNCTANALIIDLNKEASKVRSQKKINTIRSKTTGPSLRSRSQRKTSVSGSKGTEALTTDTEHSKVFNPQGKTRRGDATKESSTAVTTRTSDQSLSTAIATRSRKARKDDIEDSSLTNKAEAADCQLDIEAAANLQMKTEELRRTRKRKRSNSLDTNPSEIDTSKGQTTDTKKSRKRNRSNSFEGCSNEEDASNKSESLVVPIKKKYEMKRSTSLDGTCSNLPEEVGETLSDLWDIPSVSDFENSDTEMVCSPPNAKVVPNLETMMAALEEARAFKFVRQRGKGRRSLPLVKKTQRSGSLGSQTDGQVEVSAHVTSTSSLEGTKTQTRVLEISGNSSASLGSEGDKKRESETVAGTTAKEQTDEEACLVKENDEISSGIKDNDRNLSGEQDISSVAEDTSSNIKHTSSCASKTSSGVKETSSDVEKSSSVVMETSSVVMETLSIVKETSSGVKDTSSVVKESSSGVKDTSSVVMETSSLVMETSSHVKDTPSIVRETSSIVEVSSSYLKDGSSSVKENSENVDGSPSAVKESSSNVEDTSTSDLPDNSLCSKDGSAEINISVSNTVEISSYPKNEEHSTFGAKTSDMDKGKSSVIKEDSNTETIEENSTVSQEPLKVRQECNSVCKAKGDNPTGPDVSKGEADHEDAGVEK
ncbi:LOW QUALITY PROTEIN: mucin-4-like [Pecten maximus]|uniref:LOW QUALITY PROTEIN: mucin-4-like n=1 Tax=Pecten maximus TaxID=6579 RepID=UPI0014586CA9|nr:LOW QUALITY PROTEIN: mucin-4-like [Pecten maximus]